MMKTAQYFVQASSNRYRQEEKLRREWKSFSGAVAVYIVVVAAATFIGAAGQYDLAGDSINGFALWFLLLPAYLPLAVIGFFRWCFDWNIALAGREAYLLGICNAVQIILVWVVITAVSFKKRRPSVLHTTKHFVRILVFWGIFQLGCCAARGLWENGGFASLHHDSGAAIYSGRK